MKNQYIQFAIMFCLVTACFNDPTVPYYEVPYEHENDDLYCLETYKTNHEHQNINYTRTVYLDPTTLSDDHILAANRAVFNWNQFMNYELFKIVVTDTPDITNCGYILVTATDLKAEEGYVGFAKWNNCKARIQMDTLETSPSVFMHELGHAINLRHEELDELSIMYPDKGENQTVSELSECLVFVSILEAEKQIAINSVNDVPRLKNKSLDIEEPLQTCYIE